MMFIFYVEYQPNNVAIVRFGDQTKEVTVTLKQRQDLHVHKIAGSEYRIPVGSLSFQHPVFAALRSLIEEAIHGELSN